jgi:hypothetical protein
LEIEPLTIQGLFSSLLGLSESTDPEAPLSRWVFEDVPVDVMPVRSEELGVQNEWYEEGVENAVWKDIGPFEIRVFSPPYLLADKINAFRDRGGGDYYGSPDFEDIVRLVDGGSDLVDQVRDGNEKVCEYIQEWVNQFLEEQKPGVFIRAHIRQRGRAEIILDRLRKIVR